MSGFEWFLLFIDIVIAAAMLPTTLTITGNQIYLVSQNLTKIELWTKHWATYDANQVGKVRSK